MAATAQQCKIGCQSLADVRNNPRATKAQKRWLRTAERAFKRDYPECNCAAIEKNSLLDLIPGLRRATESTAPEPTKPMGLLDSVVSSVLPGRASTSVATTATSSGLLDNVGSAIGSVLGGTTGSLIGGVLGTIGDSVLGSSSSSVSTALPGRSTPPVGNIAPVRLEAGGTISYPGDRRPSTNKVRRMVRLLGVEQASSMLGLSLGQTASIAVRPYRRRGISAAALRVTRRTIRQVNSISHSLSKIKTCRSRR